MPLTKQQFLKNILTVYNEASYSKTIGEAWGNISTIVPNLIDGRLDTLPEDD